MKQTTRLVSPDGLREHPAAGLVPDMRPEEWREFYQDIAFRGIRVPLEVLADGTVLDGRHRLRAAHQLNLPSVPVIDAPLGSDDATVYMLKAAVLRRHLTDAQRAAMAVLWAQEHKSQGERTDLTSARRRAEVEVEAGHPTRAEATALFRVTRRQYDTARRALSSESPTLFEDLHRGELDLRQAGRALRRENNIERAMSVPAVTGLYRTISADPPWPYDNSGSRGAALDHYETLPLAAIKTLEVGGRPVRDLAPADGAHLYLWVTSIHLAEGAAAEVARAWGFEPKCVLTWVKPQLGIGNWYRSASEHVLFAVRGNLPLLGSAARPTWFQADRTRHSAKPDILYEWAVAESPGPRLELFARGPREGWEVWGDELT